MNYKNCQNLAVWWLNNLDNFTKFGHFVKTKPQHSFCKKYKKLINVHKILVMKNVKTVNL